KKWNADNSTEGAAPRIVLVVFVGTTVEEWLQDSMDVRLPFSVGIDAVDRKYDFLASFGRRPSADWAHANAAGSHPILNVWTHRFPAASKLRLQPANVGRKIHDFYARSSLPIHRLSRVNSTCWNA